MHLLANATIKTYLLPAKITVRFLHANCKYLNFSENEADMFQHTCCDRNHLIITTREQSHKTVVILP